MAPTHRVGKYILKKKIGEGAFAQVRLAIHQDTGEEFAVKVFDRRSLPAKEFEQDVRREIRIMQRLRHPSIVEVYAVLVTDRNLYLVMELVRGGELYDRIVQETRIRENIARRYFQQIVDALVYCHKQGVYHRDLKPENLLLDEAGRIKITDFGMSFMREHQDSHRLLKTQCGTAKYMSPEVIVRSGKGYDGAKLDAWECGMVLYALLAGYLPFNGEDDKATFRSILHAELEIPPHVSPEAHDVLQKLLTKDPDERTSLVEIRKHPWFLKDYYGDCRMLYPEKLALYDSVGVQLSYLKSGGPDGSMLSPRKGSSNVGVNDIREKRLVSSARPPRGPSNHTETAQVNTEVKQSLPIHPFHSTTPEAKDSESKPPQSPIVPSLRIGKLADNEDEDVDDSQGMFSPSAFRHKLSNISGALFKTLKSPRKQLSKDRLSKRNSSGLSRSGAEENNNENENDCDWFAGTSPSANSPASVMESGLRQRMKSSLGKNKQKTQKNSDPPGAISLDGITESPLGSREHVTGRRRLLQS